MKTATLIDSKTSPVGAAQRLYRLSEAYKGFEYVVVSAIALTPNIQAIDALLFGRTDVCDGETLIFGADANGTIRSYMDLPGSLRGVMDHERALREAGYTVEVPS